MKKLLSILLFAFLLSCQEEEITNFGCFYGYPSEQPGDPEPDPFQILGCGTEADFDSFQLPSGYDRVEYSPISDCSECARRATRGG